MILFLIFNKAQKYIKVKNEFTTMTMTYTCKDLQRTCVYINSRHWLWRKRRLVFRSMERPDEHFIFSLKCDFLTRSSIQAYRFSSPSSIINTNVWVVSPVSSTHIFNLHQLLFFKFGSFVRRYQGTSFTSNLSFAVPQKILHKNYMVCPYLEN